MIQGKKVYWELLHPLISLSQTAVNARRLELGCNYDKDANAQPQGALSAGPKAKPTAAKWLSRNKNQGHRDLERAGS